MSKEEKNKIIARLILSTKRKKRSFSIVEIANDIRQLEASGESLNQIASMLGISTGMLNQFLSVFKLPSNVIDLVKNRTIDSVSLIYYLSKFPTTDITTLTSLASNGKLSSHELRTLLPYRRQFRDTEIEELYNRLLDSKNIKASTIRMSDDNSHQNLETLQTIFGKIVGDSNVLNVSNKNGFIDVMLTKEGESKLRKEAKFQKKNLNQFVSELIQ